MKKMLTIFMALVLVFTLVGCAKKEEAKKVLAVVMPSATHGFMGERSKDF